MGSGSTVQWTNYLFAAGQMVGVFVERSDETVATRYFHLDHLGSVSVITDENGVVVERLSYDAWGVRRHPDGTPDPAHAITSQSTRGFTGHEQLAEVGLIHMNGRVSYDAWGVRRHPDGTPDPRMPSPAKGNSAAQAWTFDLKDALELALSYTCMWLDDTASKPEVEIHTDFGLEATDGTSMDRVIKMRENGDLDQAILEAGIKENCATRVRYGYRRVHVLLRRRAGQSITSEPGVCNNELGLQLRSKVPRRRGKAALRADRTPPSRSKLSNGSEPLTGIDFEELTTP